MTEKNEFQQIGKATPYKVPEGFFEQISEKTLQKAKQREEKRRKKVVLWSSVSVAASLTALFVIGYLMMYHPQSPGNDTLANLEQPVEQKTVPPVVEDSQRLVAKEVPMPVVAEVRKPVPEKSTVQSAAKETTEENLNDVLSAMSDEELMQLAAMYETDQFVNATEE